jgi:hypothetical protein
MAGFVVSPHQEILYEVLCTTSMLMIEGAYVGIGSPLLVPPQMHGSETTWFWTCLMQASVQTARPQWP